MEVAFPFLLELYDDYSNGLLQRDELAHAVRLVEGYVFRRAVCAIPTNSLNKTFATFTKALKKDRYLESVQAHFLLLPSYRRFPRDEEFHRDLQTRDLYHFRSRSYWLRRLENYGRKEHVPVDEYTIEHILPQNPQLSPEWRSMLGAEPQAVQEKYLHTLGNLTLTGYNAEYSDHPFDKKRDMKGGFKESPLRLNEALGQLENWNEEEILAGAQRIATRAVEVWKVPDLSAEVVEAYQSKKNVSADYSIEDHPHLLSGALRPIFDAFRKAVLALDPCVNEDFWLLTKDCG